MSKAKKVSEAELADYYNKHGINDEDWGDPQPLEQPKQRSVTLSIRFSEDEIAAIRLAASRAGLKPTALIRSRALASLRTETSRREVQAAITALVRDLERLREVADVS